MEKQKMSIHRALAELKLIDYKISTAIGNYEPVGAMQKNKKVNGIRELEEFKSNAISKTQKIEDLIERKRLIKSKIMHSNSKTTVSILNKKMTVADVIFYQEIIEKKKEYLTTLKSVKANVYKSIEAHNAKVDQNALTLANNALGKPDIKITDASVQDIVKPYIENNKVDLVDPIKIEEKIEKLEEEISVFEAEVDAKLSESNAITMIEV
jgi:hypothetical protein